ncbi:TetR/AcrR family transcriptional regulator C-terminal domain-containing protein [Nocardia concava]|uniref:TetR/AcrR family transcriptional regulator C-terminal domain-containing protein n=1 Tax=Nocardia concava TaxID=257281 RepID=UPI00068532DD|nr:TetR/AcrR family transcriptional regulator C-terminal domain-containing protein [Nocardia concava]
MGSSIEPETGTRPARRSPGRPRVPFDKIVTTAVQLVDEEGAAALSMRTLAQRLDTGTAVLYRAVTGRPELVGFVVDHVFGEVDLDIDTTDRDWRQACRAAAQTIFETLRRHRGIAPLLIEQVPTGPNALALRERFLTMLLNAGFAPEAAARTYAVLARYVLGFAAQLHDPTAPDPEPARLTALFHQLDPADFPSTIAVADCLPTQRLEDEFAFGLDMIIEGLALHHSPASR